MEGLAADEERIFEQVSLNFVFLLSRSIKFKLTWISEGDAKLKTDGEILRNGVRSAKTALRRYAPQNDSGVASRASE